MELIPTLQNLTKFRDCHLNFASNCEQLSNRIIKICCCTSLFRNPNPSVNALAFSYLERMDKKWATFNLCYQTADGCKSGRADFDSYHGLELTNK